jgi:general secretion pathway protein E
MRLGDILVRTGKVTADQVAAALRRQRDQTPHKSLGDILLEDGGVTETDLLDALGQAYGCEVLRTVTDDLLAPDLLAHLPVDWARSHGLLPIRRGSGPAVLTSDPAAGAALEDLSLLLGQELTPVLAPRAEIARAIERCYYRKEDTTENLLRDMRESAPAVAAPERGSDDLLRMADQAPVTQLVNVILLEAVKARASDVHVEPFEQKLRVRYRIDGFLYEQASPPKHLEAALVSRLKVMAKLDIAEKRLPQDGTARVRVGEREIDIRVSTIPVAEGERVVLRLLNRDSAVLPLTELGMPDDVLARFRRVIREPHGVVLVTGPTGSGKTTTLYAALQEIDTGHMNVLTVEDPIEYQLPHIGQMQVKPKIGLTFAEGLRHILRQDPDVILVGETRDLETAEIVVRASLTGHLVFSTLHTNDATSAVIRMVDMGIEPYLLSSAVRASLAQRLVRTLCPKCRRPSSLSEEETSSLGPIASRFAGKSMWSAAGCPDCLGGYRGRTGIYELMTAGTEIQEAIRQQLSSQELRRMACGLGMRTLLDDAVEKVLQGRTSISEVLRAVGQAMPGQGG